MARAKVEQDWQRVATAVRQRRLELGFRRQQEAADAAGIGVQTWRQIENARQDHYTAAITMAVERLLAWPYGTLEAVAAGAAVPDAEVPPDALKRLDVVEERLDRVEGALREILADDGAAP